MNEAYTKQVRLLLDVLPEVAKETCFAMHGGTAINLFVREMPRLSVDIDLTYTDIAERVETLKPDWSIYEYQKFPSVRWKLQNLERFSKDKPEAYQQQLCDLEAVLTNG